MGSKCWINIFISYNCSKHFLKAIALEKQRLLYTWQGTLQFYNFTSAFHNFNLLCKTGLNSKILTSTTAVVPKLCSLVARLWPIHNRAGRAVHACLFWPATRAARLQIDCCLVAGCSLGIGDPCTRVYED